MFSATRKNNTKERGRSGDVWRQFAWGGEETFSVKRKEKLFPLSKRKVSQKGKGFQDEGGAAGKGKRKKKYPDECLKEFSLLPEGQRRVRNKKIDLGGKKK